MASRPVWHAVLAVDIGVVRRRDLHRINREGVFVAARNGRVAVETAGDTLALETTFAQEIAFAERIRACEARERVAAV